MSRRSTWPGADRALPAAHLTFDELELGDLALSLAVGPVRDDRGAHGCDVTGDAIGERGDEAGPTAVEPRIQIGFGLRRIMTWKASMISRASTSNGTPASTAATVSVSAFESVSRQVVISRAMVLAEAMRCRGSASACSARRRRVAHSVTTRSEPRKLCGFRYTN